jgi:DNA-binding PadR family transcriptional regulator
MKKPTPTHYAVLGLLAARPWSAYELIQYMNGSYLRFFWSKTEARLYETPKELAGFGWASTKKERISANPEAKGRLRTVYTITPEGLDALKTWLEEPAQPPSFEIEFLLKLAFSEQGSLKAFLANVHQAHEAMLTGGRKDVIANAAVAPQLPGRVHLSAYMADLVGRIVRTYTDWLKDLETGASNWQEIAPSPENEEAGKQHYKQLLKKL